MKWFKMINNIASVSPHSFFKYDWLPLDKFVQGVHIKLGSCCLEVEKGDGIGELGYGRWEGMDFIQVIKKYVYIYFKGVFLNVLNPLSAQTIFHFPFFFSLSVFYFILFFIFNFLFTHPGWRKCALKSRPPRITKARQSASFFSRPLKSIDVRLYIQFF